MPAVYPITWEPVEATGYYKHLQRRDLAVWERWIEKYGKDWEAVAYDVAIGGVSPADETLSESDRLGWKYTTALKIDALVRGPEGVWIIEVKPAASASAIGAALTYQLVLAREEPELPIAGAGIACEHLPPDIEWACAQLNVRTWLA